VQTSVDSSSLVALRKMQAPGQPDAVGRIITLFLAETDQRIEELARASGAGDAPAIQRAAHALKGIAGTVGALEILDLAERLERTGRTGHAHGAADLVTELGAAVDRARPIFIRLREGV
jgi:HPt (histidine-containing phosphotransfer) domain-containing protein